jgi:maltose/maltodextrin transport system substrate-binding protein
MSVLKEKDKMTQVVLYIVCILAVTPAHAFNEEKLLQFDRTKLHVQAVEESLKPIHPGIPGKVQFWNRRARQFMYAPAFDFKPVQGAKVYRFTATAYGPGWRFVTNEPKTTLEPIWKDLPCGKFELQFSPIGVKGGDALRLNGPAQYKGIWFTKETGAEPKLFSFDPVNGATGYLFVVRMPKEYVFEAEEPWASLTPIWKDLPPGKVSLYVEGLERKGGKSLGKAGSIEFERKAVFNGPYHVPAFDYIEAGKQWLNWLADGVFKGWTKEGDPARLGQYPCKYEVAAIEGLLSLAEIEKDNTRRTKLLQMAMNAARTLIKGSFPSDWALAGFPPTYNRSGGYGKYEIVMMQYPADAGMAYLDLYAVTREKEFLDAAVRIAEIYKRTQLQNGTWHLLVDGRTGDKADKSMSPLMPYEPIRFLERLIHEYGMMAYRPVVESAWKWLDTEILQTFRFEGQFEDTCAGGSSEWNLSHWSACSAAELLFKRATNRTELVAMAEDALRLAEDQFVIWELPQHPEQFTPCALEQYMYMVSIQAGAAQFIRVYSLAYETTGKELYLAKAVAFANAMTVLQKESGGNFVNTYWKKARDGNDWGDWPNCHVYSARTMIEFGNFLKRHRLRISLNPESCGNAEAWYNSYVQSKIE